MGGGGGRTESVHHGLLNAHHSIFANLYIYMRQMLEAMLGDV